MNRRGFLTAVGALTAGFILDGATGLLMPRKKIWQVPRAYSISHIGFSYHDPTTGILYEHWMPSKREFYPYMNGKISFLLELERVEG